MRDGEAEGWRPDRALLNAFPQVTVAVDLDGNVTALNTRALRFLLDVASVTDGTDDVGSRGDLTGKPLVDLLLHGPSQGAFGDVLGLARRGGDWVGELTVVPHHGVPQQATVSVRPVVLDQVVLGALVVVEEVEGAAGQDVSERLTRLARVAAELVLADSVDAVTRIVVEHMAQAAGATVASLSMLVDADTLALVGVRGGRQGVERRWATYSVHDHTPAGQAVRDGRVVVLNGEQEIRRRYPDLETAAPGDRSIACLPLRIGERVVGVASMSYPGSQVISAAELEFLAVMADTCAQALERVRVAETASDRLAQIQFLADSSLELSSSLDYEATLRKVARLAVPWFADWCAIAVEQDGELRTLAVEHVDPQKVALAEELQRRFPADPSDERGAYQVLRSGVSELTPEITDEMLVQVIEDPDQLRLFRELHLRSAMSVPLKVQDRVLGVVTWVAGEEGRRFSRDDLVFGEDLARRAALAIDTARLHGELSDVATRLQRAVLPADLPKVPGWQIAACYLQAGDSDAGGDFYDVSPLGDGRLSLFVGDVMGRGVTAAAAMAQMRAAIRALVAVEPDPRTVLLALDRLFEHYDFHQLVTLVYGIADPDRDELVLVNAGHVPPVVRRADGSVEVVEGEPGLLLGAGGSDREPMVVPFRAGDLLLCYTDGLVERRDEDIATGVDRLADACRDTEPGELSTWLDDVVAAVRDTRREDDVALLAVRRTA